MLSGAGSHAAGAGPAACPPSGAQAATASASETAASTGSALAWTRGRRAACAPPPPPPQLFGTARAPALLAAPLQLPVGRDILKSIDRRDTGAGGQGPRGSRRRAA